MHCDHLFVHNHMEWIHITNSLHFQKKKQEKKEFEIELRCYNNKNFIIYNKSRNIKSANKRVLIRMLERKKKKKTNGIKQLSSQVY